MSASVTPLSQVGVFRVLTQEFLQHRKAVVRNYHSMSDSEEVRWVSQQSLDGVSASLLITCGDTITLC